jgi:hypothetical protein
MPTTDTFYVSLKDNKVRRATEPSREYFIPGGKKEGKAKYMIEVFGYNHEKVANEVRDMVDKGGMTDKLFSIRVETR